MLREEASKAAKKLVSYRWQKTNEAKRSDFARNLAHARWKESRKKELEAEAQRERQLAGAGA
jgi:hypothetical protein